MFAEFAVFANIYFLISDVVDMKFTLLRKARQRVRTRSINESLPMDRNFPYFSVGQHLTKLEFTIATINIIFCARFADKPARY